MADAASIILSGYTPADLQKQQDAHSQSLASVAASNQATNEAQQLQPYKLQAVQQQIDTSDIDNKTKQLALAGHLLGSVNDEASYQRAKQQAAAWGIPTTNLPDNYDPNVINRLIYANASATALLNSATSLYNQGNNRQLKADTATGAVNAGAGAYNQLQPGPMGAPPIVPNAPPARAGDLQPLSFSTAQTAQAANAAANLPATGQVLPPAAGPAGSSALPDSASVVRSPNAAPVTGVDPSYQSMVQPTAGMSPAQAAAMPTGKVPTVAAQKLAFQRDPDAQAAVAGAKASATQQAAVDSALHKAENTQQGDALGKEYGAIQTAADQAIQQKNLVQQLRTDSESWSTGAGAYTAGQGRRILQALGMTGPVTDQQIADQQSFEKVAGQVLRQQVKQTSGRAAVQEFNLIAKTLPNDGTDHNALINITAQLQGQNDYDIAKQQAATQYQNLHGGSLKGFDQVYNDNVTPGAFVLPYLSNAQRDTLFQNILKEPGGDKTLQQIKNSYVYAKTNGLIQ